MSYEEEDTCHCQRAMLHMRRRIHVIYEEEDTCHCQRAMLHMRRRIHVSHMRRRIHATAREPCCTLKLAQILKSQHI